MPSGNLVAEAERVATPGEPREVVAIARRFIERTADLSELERAEERAATVVTATREQLDATSDEIRA